MARKLCIKTPKKPENRQKTPILLENTLKMPILTENSPLSPYLLFTIIVHSIKIPKTPKNRQFCRKTPKNIEFARKLCIERPKKPENRQKTADFAGKCHKNADFDGKLTLL